MSSTSGASRPARTLLERLIRERNQTLEEFAAFAEDFAQEHGEPGTLSAGHLQRLVAGRRYDGRPLGRVRPATARLLERIFDVKIEALLSTSDPQINEDNPGVELRERLRTSERVDINVIRLLHEQLDAIRRLDRQLGAIVARSEVEAKIEQVELLFSYSLSPDTRSRLAALLTELCMLAGWQALDLGHPMESWQHYETAKYAASESNSRAFEAHAAAQHAFVLIDIERPAEATALLAAARAKVAASSPAVLRSWLAAAHGEALAANGEGPSSLRAFDDAGKLLTAEKAINDGPYVVLDSTHLDRWRGHALARLRPAEAATVLSGTLDRLDPSFARAETALRVDLAVALTAVDERDEARRQASYAARLAEIIGSARQQRRVQALMAEM
ncbi:hypothetical protein LWC34_54845 [Kibdelosporangium philippinense]|uniref:XRE family transcriptional regulator n=1 Tax=Kibdelosporangium philippinense TaxID=211113 RepID=A0ABS8ZVV9_9PSEU|nr:hypothetical protein [Kibdelosporangium philippinense]MCE7011836.1 hypothetical protein [Kibdelosporangium philippinense]